MVYSEYAKVKNVLTVDTQWGRRRVCNVITNRGEEAIWANDLNAFSNIKPGQTINVIRGDKGSLTILEKDEDTNNNIQMNRPSSQKEGGHYTYTSNNQEDKLEHSSPKNEEHSSAMKEQLPMLSNAQKKELAAYIKQQASMFKHITDTVSSVMPDLKPQDHRAISMSIFIDIQKRL